MLPFDEDIQTDMLEESKELIFASVAVGLLVAAIQGVLGRRVVCAGGDFGATFLGCADRVFLTRAGGGFGTDLGPRSDLAGVQRTLGKGIVGGGDLRWGIHGRGQYRAAIVAAEPDAAE